MAYDPPTPMINSLTLGSDALPLADEDFGLYSNHMLYELLVGHEESIARNRLDRQRAVGTAGFLTALIDHHETAAAALRDQFGEAERAEPPVADDLLQVS
jgi:hypothetical protein